MNSLLKKLTTQEIILCNGIRLDRLAVAMLLALSALIALPVEGEAACNLRPGAKAAFDGTQGSVNRPFAGPGEALEVSLRSCDDSPGLGATASDHNVTVLFTPDSGTPTAVVLTAEADCTSLASPLTACEAALGGKAYCVAGINAAVELVNRSGTDTLSFRFPDTDARCDGGTDAGTPCGSNADCVSNDCSAGIDSRTLSGKAIVAVTDSADALPCSIVDCETATDTIACIDRLYNASGSCSTDQLGKTFPSFTALPSPNIYALECVDSLPPCNPFATAELRIGLDTHGNALIPFLWDGVREQLEGEAVARIVRATVAQDISVPGQSFVASFSPEGRRLDPVFEPKPGVAGSLTLFGSTDAPYTILRVASGSDSGLICAGGTSEGSACNEAEECPGGSCEPASCVDGADDGQPCLNDSECDGVGVCGAKLFDFSPLIVDAGQGPAVLQRDASGSTGVCELDTSLSCSADCGGDGECVSYKLEASTTVPLDGLLPRDELANFAVTERIDGLDLNNDGDVVDLVMTIRDNMSGDLIPLGAPAAACGIPANGSEPVFGRAVVRTASPPLLLPAGATANGFLAFLEPESGQNNCDINQDDETDDAYLRIFTSDAAQIARGTEIAADEATVINDRALIISDNKIFFRTSEPETANKSVLIASQNSDTVVQRQSTPANGPSSDPEISADGKWVTFASTASNLITGATNGKLSIFATNLLTGEVRRVSENFNGDDPLTNCFRPSINKAGWVAFESLAQNLDQFDLEDFITDNDVDVFVGSILGSPNRISDTNASTDPDGHSSRPSIGTLGTAFESTSTDLIGPGEDTNAKDDIYFAPSFFSGSNKIRISDPVGAAQSNGNSNNAAMAEDVMVIAFDSNATNLVPGQSEGSLRDVFVYDGTGAAPFIEKVSADVNGSLGNGISDNPRISGNGRFVAFDSTSRDLIVGDTNARVDVFVHDRWFHKTIRVSVSTGGGQANDDSELKSISNDGRYVFFSSEADNLISDDTNGNIDYFIHDLVARTTIRANVDSSGNQVTGELSFGNGDIADNGAVVVWSASDSSYSGADTNGVSDIYYRAPDGSLASNLNGDSDARDVVIRSFDLLNPPTIANIAEADAAKIVDENILFSAVRANGGIDSINLQTFRYWDGSAATTIGMTPDSSLALSDTMFMSEDVIAVIDDEALLWDEFSVLETTDANGDGDSLDGYLVVRDHCSPIASCDNWSIPTGTGGHALIAAQLLQPLNVSGPLVVMVVDESNHGPAGTSLNGDADAFDDVLHIYDSDTSSTMSTGFAVADFVLGERTNVAACGGDVHLVAFRVPEAQQGNTNLNGPPFETDIPEDTDTDDAVMHVHDLVSGTTVNLGQAARPCEFADCDPRTPYRVNGSKVVFLTLESDQGGGFGQDVSGEGDLGDLVVQQYDFCTDVITAIERATENSSLDPTDVVDESRVMTTLAGRCDDGPCTPGPGACEAGSFCEADECLTAFGLCSRHLSIECTSNTDCARCIDLYPGACESDEDCSGGAFCLPQVVTAVESGLDSDGDGVNDGEDGCPGEFDPSGNDSDGDGVPDACDLQTCRLFPRGGCKSPGEGKASISLKNDANDKKDKLQWKWGKGDAVTKAEFGNPLLTDTYELCVYSNGLLTTASAPPGGTCDKKGRKPCWKDFSKGYKYKDSLTTPQGLSNLQLKEGAEGKSKVKVAGKGERLSLPDFGAISGELIVQLVNNSTGECFDAGFVQPFKKHTDTQIKAKGGVATVTTTTTTTIPPCMDADNDGFLDAACGGLDCYDSNPAVNPGQTGYFTTHRGDGSFDYNCSGAEEKLIGVGRCLSLTFGSCTKVNIPGLISTTACGASNSLVVDCGAPQACPEITSGTDVEECH